MLKTIYLNWIIYMPRDTVLTFLWITFYTFFKHGCLIINYGRQKLALCVNCCSNGGPSRVTLQDIVRNDPGYTPNIEHLVFPERKSSNPNLTGVIDGSPPSKSKSNATSSGRSRIAEVFARHYARGSSQDSSVTSRKNHVNVRNFETIVRINLLHWSNTLPFFVI